MSLWLFALALFVLPFMRTPVSPHWDAEDPNRSEELDLPFGLDVGDFDDYAAEEGLGLDQTLADAIASSSREFYAADSDRLRGNGLVDTGRLDAGQRVYDLHCAGCHSLSGDGAGPAARFLSPRPRNFRRGIFKFKSTSSGERPLREDLFQTVTRGLSGSAMPDFRLLSEEKRWDVVEYIRYLALRGEFEQLMLDVAWEDDELPDPDSMANIIDRRWDPENLRAQFPTEAETDRDDASIERGRVLFIGTKATCSTCHGAGGRGDGPVADGYTDSWGYPIRPRDLTTGVFRAGSSGKDLWLTVANGIGGTPMPSYGGALSGAEIWDLVHFVQYLASTRPGEQQTSGDSEEN